MDDEHKQLLNTDIKLLTQDETGKITVFNGRVLSVSNTFLTVLDFKTNTEITVPIERILRIERTSGDKDSQKY